MATHSSILAWKIPWTEESGGLHTVPRVTESDMTEWLTLSLSERGIQCRNWKEVKLER